MINPDTPEQRISFLPNVPVPELLDTAILVQWIDAVANEEGKRIARAAYTLVDDNTLLEMNQEYLDHHTLTDILTFPYEYEPIRTDIIISVDRTRDNAESHNTSPQDELNRVIIHGILHMCGWTDQSEQDRAAMRQKEQECLALLAEMVTKI